MASAPPGKLGLWDSLLNCICRPPRDEYGTQDLTGGRHGRFTISQKRFRRDDFVLPNKFGQLLQCSLYRARGSGKQKRPCVIYCHCNSGSRRDAEEALYVLLPYGISVMCFDFAGSGISEGSWVTLGAREVEDVEAVVGYLRSTGITSAIGLWGRSMGAVTAMMYARRDPSIAGLVLDSPFAKLTDLMTELVAEQKLPIPRPFMRIALSMMRRSVKKRAAFSIDDVAPLDFVGETHVPVLFGHATQDTFVNVRHSQQLYAAYAGAKDSIMFVGDHDSVRPSSFYRAVCSFFQAALQCPDQLLVSHAISTVGLGHPLAAEAKQIQYLSRGSLPPPSWDGMQDGIPSPGSLRQSLCAETHLVQPHGEPAFPTNIFRSASSDSTAAPTLEELLSEDASPMTRSNASGDDPILGVARANAAATVLDRRLSEDGVELDGSSNSISFQDSSVSQEEEEEEAMLQRVLLASISQQEASYQVGGAAWAPLVALPATAHAGAGNGSSHAANDLSSPPEQLEADLLATALRLSLAESEAASGMDAPSWAALPPQSPLQLPPLAGCSSPTVMQHCCPADQQESLSTALSESLSRGQQRRQQRQILESAFSRLVSAASCAHPGYALDLHVLADDSRNGPFAGRVSPSTAAPKQTPRSRSGSPRSPKEGRIARPASLPSSSPLKVGGYGGSPRIQEALAPRRWQSGSLLEGPQFGSSSSSSDGGDSSPGGSPGRPTRAAIVGTALASVAHCGRSLDYDPHTLRPQRRSNTPAAIPDYRPPTVHLLEHLSRLASLRSESGDVFVLEAADAARSPSAVTHASPGVTSHGGDRLPPDAIAHSGESLLSWHRQNVALPQTTAASDAYAASLTESQRNESAPEHEGIDACNSGASVPEWAESRNSYDHRMEPADALLRGVDDVIWTKAEDVNSPCSTTYGRTAPQSAASRSFSFTSHASLAEVLPPLGDPLPTTRRDTGCHAAASALCGSSSSHSADGQRDSLATLPAAADVRLQPVEPHGTSCIRGTPDLQKITVVPKR